MTPYEEMLCEGSGACGHPRREHKKNIEGFQAACTHKLSRSGREVACSCRRFKEVRTGSSVSKPSPEAVKA